MQFFWVGLGRATQNLARVGPLKTHGPRAKFRVGLWPDPALALGTYYLLSISAVTYQPSELIRNILSEKNNPIN